MRVGTADALRRPGGPLYVLDGVAPVIAADAWVAPTAAVIGRVEIGSRSGVWFHCVLRGDTNFIRVGARVNIQDGTIVHVNAGHFPTIIEDDVTIGHAAIVHACTLRARAFVAMGATVLDGAVIEAGGVLAAGSVLPPGKVIGPGELWMGSPAKLKRVLSVEERAEFDRTAVHYAELAGRYARGLG
ncbi:MAG TPA: gamma carbonic anhydrase family protein [Acetobacteraceae bacterium]|nr:gamma carbonic anhydrase family protein [Acetobacteraceae bacterium]